MPSVRAVRASLGGALLAPLRLLLLQHADVRAQVAHARVEGQGVLIAGHRARGVAHRRAAQAQPRSGLEVPAGAGGWVGGWVGAGPREP